MDLLATSVSVTEVSASVRLSSGTSLVSSLLLDLSSEGTIETDTTLSVSSWGEDPLFLGVSVWE